MKIHEVLLVATLTYQAGMFVGQKNYKVGALFLIAAIAIGCCFTKLEKSTLTTNSMNSPFNDLLAQVPGLASSFDNIFSDKAAVPVAAPTPAALPAPDAIPSNKAGE